MARKYYINGWREGKSYFYSLVYGRFTDQELERLERGEAVTKGDNEFQIIEEEQ